MQFFLTHYLINSIILFYFQFEWMSWVNELIKLRKMNEQSWENEWDSEDVVEFCHLSHPASHECVVVLLAKFCQKEKFGI
jgi:hypothetical protein